MTIAAVVTAAGSGTRLGRSLPKALVLIAGTPMVTWAVSTASQTCTRIIVTAPADALDDFRAALASIESDVSVVAGGADRQGSVALGLAELGGALDAVLVHDAARPFTPVDVFHRALEGLDDADGVVPVVPLADTIVRVGSGGFGYLDRESLAAVQTPQAFRPAPLLDAHSRAARDGVGATDDGALLAHYGYRVVTCEGDLAARKITYPQDLELAEQLRARA